MSRRFPHRFDIDKYSSDELRLIFFKIVEETAWNIENKEEIPVDFFESNKDLFKYNGGDMLTFGLSKKRILKGYYQSKKKKNVLKQKKK